MNPEKLQRQAESEKMKRIAQMHSFLNNVLIGGSAAMEQVVVLDLEALAKRAAETGKDIEDLEITRDTVKDMRTRLLDAVTVLELGNTRALTNLLDEAKKFLPKAFESLLPDQEKVVPNIDSDSDIDKRNSGNQKTETKARRRAEPQPDGQRSREKSPPKYEIPVLKTEQEIAEAVAKIKARFIDAINGSRDHLTRDILMNCKRVVALRYSADGKALPNGMPTTIINPETARFPSYVVGARVFLEALDVGLSPQTARDLGLEADKKFATALRDSKKQQRKEVGKKTENELPAPETIRSIGTALEVVEIAASSDRLEIRKNLVLQNTWVSHPFRNSPRTVGEAAYFAATTGKKMTAEGETQAQKAAKAAEKSALDQAAERIKDFRTPEKMWEVAMQVLKEAKDIIDTCLAAQIKVPITRLPNPDKAWSISDRAEIIAIAKLVHGLLFERPPHVKDRKGSRLANDAERKRLVTVWAYRSKQEYLKWAKENEKTIKAGVGSVKSNDHSAEPASGTEPTMLGTVLAEGVAADDNNGNADEPEEGVALNDAEFHGLIDIRGPIISLLDLEKDQDFNNKFPDRIGLLSEILKHPHRDPPRVVEVAAFLLALKNGKSQEDASKEGVKAREQFIQEIGQQLRFELEDMEAEDVIKTAKVAITMMKRTGLIDSDLADNLTDTDTIFTAVFHFSQVYEGLTQEQAREKAGLVLKAYLKAAPGLSTESAAPVNPPLLEVVEEVPASTAQALVPYGKDVTNLATAGAENQVGFYGLGLVLSDGVKQALTGQEVREETRAPWERVRGSVGASPDAKNQPLALTGKSPESASQGELANRFSDAIAQVTKEMIRLARNLDPKAQSALAEARRLVITLNDLKKGMEKATNPLLKNQNEKEIGKQLDLLSRQLGVLALIK